MADTAPSSPKPISRDTYYARYSESGEHVELIEGQVYRMAPVGPRHGYTVELVRSIIEPQLAAPRCVREEKPISLPGDSDPEPDIAVVLGPRSRYKARHPSADDILLIIEVADNSLRHDRNVKAPLYAKHGIPEYWIVDLNNRVVIVHRDPRDARYRQSTTHTEGRLEALGVSVDIREILT